MKLDDKELPIVDDFRQSNIKGLYVAGDLIAGKNGNIIRCFNDAYSIVGNIKSNL